MTIDTDRLRLAYEKARKTLLDERGEAGHWTGQLSTSALSTATAISALSAFEKCSTSNRSNQPILDRAVCWLAENQNDDGGWGDTQKSYSNIATTLLVIAALHFCNRQTEFKELIALAERYVEKQGGIAGLRKRYGKDKTFAVPILANCAMAGTVDWKEVSALPFEAACVPQKFYHLMQLPVVSYAIPALVAIGQTKFFHDPPWNPIVRLIRKLSVGRSLRVLERMQPASGGFLEAIPLTSFVVMGLSTSGKHTSPVVKNGIKFILDSVLDDGSWPIDTNLATWTTTLSVNSLSNNANTKLHTASSSESIKNIVNESGADARNSKATEHGEVSNDLSSLPKTSLQHARGHDVFDDPRCLQWILSCQNKTVHPFTNSPPGGWGWTDLSGAVPDADDTPGAMLALANFAKHADLSTKQKSDVTSAAISGVDWLLKLQNRDKGWPTFCRGWGKLPFDRSGADITAHCLRGIYAWKDNYPNQAKLERAIKTGISYLEKTQNPDGSWLPLWFGNQDHPQEENPVYGTAKVLAALFELDLSETNVVAAGLRWLRSVQNPDGSWGGGVSVTKSIPALGSLPGTATVTGSVEETALAIEVLLCEQRLTTESLVSKSQVATDRRNAPADIDKNTRKNQLQIENGINWLIRAVETDCFQIDWPIGFYFAKLWYHEKLYPQIFTVAALGRAVGLFDVTEKKP